MLDPETKSDVHWSESKNPTSTATIPVAEEQRVTNDHSHVLSRHKSIRKRLGRLLVYFMRIQPTATQEICEYRYTGELLELPAGGTPVAGSATPEEMPASFPTSSLSTGDMFELEGPYTSMNRISATNESNENHQLHSRQGYSKQEFVGDISMYRAPTQLATPKSLPRLAVPAPIHNLPAMTNDQSPHSASTISPNTPVGHFSNNTQPYWNLHSGPQVVSPCDTTSTLPWYRSRPQQPQSPHTFTSPSTPSSAGSFNLATPLSAYPEPARASFGAWPQPGPEYLRTAFPQRYQPINHESITHLAPGFDSQSWATEMKPHQCCHHVSHANHQGHGVQSQAAMTPVPQYIPLMVVSNLKDEKSAYNESNLLPAIHIHEVNRSNAEESFPPAYSPLAASPSAYPPAACDHCNKVFTGKYGKGNLTRHVRQIHESHLGGAIHICRFCMKTYNRADALRKHSWKKHRDEHSKPNKRRRS